MNFLTDFIENHLISILETQLAAHAPELQEAFLAEVKMMSEKTLFWIESKLTLIRNKAH